MFLFGRTPLEIIIPSGDPVVKEVTAVLREWGELWKKLFVVRGISWDHMQGESTCNR